MKNEFQQYPAKVLDVLNETPDTKRFVLQYKDKKKQANFDFIHGQFMMLGLAGFGEAPFGICSRYSERKKNFQLAVRKAGDLTEKLHEVKKGDEVLARGPYGNGFPEFGDKNILAVAGGCGFIPLRSVLESYMEDEFKKPIDVQVFFGCENQKSLLFKNRYKDWRKKMDLHIILEKPEKKWSGAKGMVTDLFGKVDVVKNAVAVLCGPPVMYKFVVKKLKEHGFADKDIYMSLERRMHCGVGICQHCAIGSKYVCTDGPIFSYAELKDIKGAI